ncbi:DUF5655 domain-containing protein [Paraburkholderia sp. BR10954]|uniref:DUF5655 domain-containing protein n=1 Tax=Paraburkholderia sp. BR10954 TaxID=3236995 RepID=UPI0034D30128
MKYVPIKTVALKGSSSINERWVQDVITENPAVLGLGELTLIAKERRQYSGGRLDMLFEDSAGDGAIRYAVELQLGATDESHIIRTIEYWDIERRRYPQYEHVAVLIAENVTTRFLNVVSLFNGHIPIVAFQLTAIESGDGVGLLFTKIVDAFRLGSAEEDEVALELTDRSYWESRAQTVKLADRVLNMCKSFDPSLELNYNKHYIGFKKSGISFNFASCRPRKAAMNLSIRIQKNESVDRKLEESGLDLLEYARHGAYRIKLHSEDIEKNQTFLLELLKKAYDDRA